MMKTITAIIAVIGAITIYLIFQKLPQKDQSYPSGGTQSAPGQANWKNITRTQPDEYGVVCYNLPDNASVSCVRVK